MNLRNYSCQKYPRVGRATSLDWHISLSVFSVLMQAFVQCLIMYISDSTNSESEDFDHAVGWINFFLIVMLNVGTYWKATCWQKLERQRVESKVRFYTGFNLEPLGEYKEREISKTVEVKARERGVRLQVYSKIVENIMEGRERVAMSTGPTCSWDNFTRTMYKIDF